MSSIERRSSTTRNRLNANNALAIDNRMFIKILYPDNNVLVINLLCKCLHFINYVKKQLNISPEENIDLIDTDGTVKEIPLSFKEYVNDYLTPANSYFILRIEADHATGEKRITPFYNDSRITYNLMRNISNLNNGRLTAARERQQQKVKETQSKKQTSTSHTSSHNTSINSNHTQVTHSNVNTAGGSGTGGLAAIVLAATSNTTAAASSSSTTNHTTTTTTTSNGVGLKHLGQKKKTR